MASQSEQPQPEGKEDFKPKKIENRRPSRRSVPRLNNESVRMQQIKTLQAQLTSIIPDDNDGADSDGININVGEDSQVDVSSVLRNHYYTKRTSALSVPAPSRRTSLSSIESISSAPTSSTPRTSSISYTDQSVALGRSSSVADDKSDDNNNNTKSVNRRPKFRPSRLSEKNTTSCSTTSTIASSTSSAKSSTGNTSSDGDDYEDFLTFLNKGENHNNDNLNPQSSPNVDVSRESDVVSEKSSISNKLKSSFGLSFKSNKRQRQNMQLPTYEFLVKDNHDGASTLPKTSWWHGVFFFSFISLIACIITLWVSLYYTFISCVFVIYNTSTHVLKFVAFHKLCSFKIIGALSCRCTDDQ